MDLKQNQKIERISLSEFISLIGIEAAGALFEVPVNTMRSYKYGYRQPSPKVAKRMMSITNGKLDFESIYGPIEEKKSA